MKQLIIKELKLAKRKLKKALKDNLVEMRFFGSRYKGNHKGLSDLDILVILKNKNIKDEDKVFEILNDLELKLNIPLDIVVHSLDIWQKELKHSTPFSQSVLKNSIVI